MKLRFNPFLRVSAVIGAACTVSVNAEILTFNGNRATDVTTHTINATDWADYVGGSGTFNSANDWGRVYWRGSAGDGQYMHFNLSSLNGLTIVAPTTVTLQNANSTWGGSVDGSYVATANGTWTAAGGQPIPGATAISNAVNATGSYGSGASVSWGIGYTAFQGIVDTPSSYYGLAVIGGSGSTLHFSGPANPYLTVQTGTISTGNVISANTGSATWNSSNYGYVANSGSDYAIANTLTISGALAEGISGAGTIAINNGGTVAVNQAGGVNYYQAIDGTTINTGGKLTINAHSNISNLTLAGGELASTGSDATWGSWGINGTTTVTGGVTSTISANQVTLSSGVFDVGSGSTLNFTGWASGGSLTKTGAGTMQFRGWQSYTGGTTINNGTLELIGQNSGNGWLRGAVTVNSGGTLKFTGGDGSGFGWNSSPSSLTINGGTFDTTAGAAHVGFGSYLTVALSNGGTITGSGQWNGDGLLGFSSSGDSTNTISGSWTLRSDNGANHTFNVANGAAATDLRVDANLSDQYPDAWWVARSNLVKSGAGTMVLAGSNSYDGQTDIQAGTLVAASSNALGTGGWDGNTMSFIQNGASLALQGGVSLNEHFHVWGSGVGGNGAIRSISGNNALTMTYGGGGSGPGFALRSNTTVGVDADTLTATGFYQDGGSWGITKVGAGTLNFTQDSTYTGATTVSAGKLVVNGNISTSATIVQAGGALGGAGTVGAVNVQSGGVFAPGNSPGTMTLTGDLVLDAGSISDFEINAFTSGNFDLAVAAASGSQNVQFNGTLNLLFQSGFNTMGSVKIFDFDSYSGSFSSVVSSGLAGGYTATFDNSTGIVTVVPEPAPALLGGLGILCLLRRRRP
ncbi:MAG: hypothetical protein EAZ65_01655 [Verrucomicrobia bacterium]|nr:MAG: hypothetical protein EAZ84_05190 [Verrucomicrobiota bacterium]TAE89096.1 MAG: hypothetical protein EAZ82_00245 [Verrucomicrobiota bacterium]TAF28031.1 MAG: hypothetical protein EAZ71_01660 [Verrucomicrobiota bacterium]TAF42878.1 MAG: hypothetical protein EAZ65_01655 [Verrucomicrobiota bacterium]